MAAAQMGKSAGLGVWKLAGPRTGQERPGGALPSAGHSGVQRWRWSWAPEEHGRSEAHTAWPLPAQGAWSFHFSEGHLHGCQMKSRTSCFRHFVVKKKKGEKAPNFSSLSYILRPQRIVAKHFSSIFGLV